MISAALSHIESIIGGELPATYRRFLSDEVGDNDPYEITTVHGDSVYLYSYHNIIERNQTYRIQDAEPHVLLIGQDGNIGYFIRRGHNEAIYSADLGALGCLEMDEEAKNIYLLRA